MVEGLIDAHKSKTALRYAMCGYGDQLFKGGDGGTRVQVRGCGHVLCPRCGRRKGGRYTRRVLGWLAHEAHGDLFNVCFTQKIKAGEGVATARRRMERKVRGFMKWATREGLLSGMTVHHIVWSQKREGWHYHAHAVLEFPAGRFVMAAVDAEGGLGVRAFIDQWTHQSAAGGETVRALWHKFMLPGGGPIIDLQGDSGDSEFWTESPSEVARIVQYPMRDLAAGVSAWKLGGDPERMKSCVLELLKEGGGWKMRRGWGRWRKDCPAAVAARKAELAAKDGGEPAEAGESAAPGPGPEPLGTVRHVWKLARAGTAWAREALKGLERSTRNDSDFARRLVAFVRAAVDPPG